MTDWIRFSNPTRPPKAMLERAVEAMQVYLGAVDWASLPAQQKLYNRVRKQVETLDKKTGFSTWDQIEQEARRRGIVRPMPGRHL